MLISIRNNCYISLGVFLIITFFSNLSYGYIERISVDLKEVNIPEAIKMITKSLKQNIVISPSVSGTVSLRLKDVLPNAALHLLLISAGLAQMKMDNILFIASRDELIKIKQGEIKWHELMDEASPLLRRTWQIQYGNVDDIAKILNDERTPFISKRGHLSVDKRTNLISLSDTSEKMYEADNLIRRLDVPIKQILIEARLATIDHDFERELGIDFKVHAEPARDKNNNITTPLSESQRGFSVAVAALADGALLDVKLMALENKGHAELISRPSLFTGNQETALIEAGEEVPYQEVSDSGGTAISFKKAVLGLTVTPQVMPGNKVLLHLQISQDRPSTRIVLGVPTISTRKIMTHVLVKSGETVVLGGIYEKAQEKNVQGLPVISKIPLIGWLFKKQNTRTSKRELFIFVTPKVIS